jgi:hypothetical protein
MPPIKTMIAASLALSFALVPLSGICAPEASGDTIEVQFSPYTYHFSQSDEHRNVVALALSSVDRSGWLWGGAYFRNSFGQPCAYLFGGRKYEEPFGLSRVYWSWTAGILYGYKPPYEDKVPFNHNGSLPSAIASLPVWARRCLCWEPRR